MFRGSKSVSLSSNHSIRVVFSQEILGKNLFPVDKAAFLGLWPLPAYSKPAV
jgi:hypothetical protein